MGIHEAEEIKLAPCPRESAVLLIHVKQKNVLCLNIDCGAHDTQVVKLCASQERETIPHCKQFMNVSFISDSSLCHLYDNILDPISRFAPEDTTKSGVVAGLVFLNTTHENATVFDSEPDSVITSIFGVLNVTRFHDMSVISKHPLFFS